METVLLKQVFERIERELGKEFLHGLLVGAGKVNESRVSAEFVNGVKVSLFYESFLLEQEKQIICENTKGLISVGDTVFYKRFVEQDVVPVTVVKVHKTDRVTVNDGSRNFAIKASNILLQETTCQQ